MAKAQDVHVADTVAQALAAGMSESTVESQHVRAIAVLTAKAAASDDGGNTALTAAIAVLNTNLAHVRDPKNK